MPVTIKLSAGDGSNDKGLQCSGTYPEFQSISTKFVPIVKSDANALVIQQTLDSSTTPATGSLGNYFYLQIASNLIKFGVPNSRGPFNGTLTFCMKPPTVNVTPELKMLQAGPYKDGVVTWPGAMNDGNAPFNNQGVVTLSKFENDCS